MSRKAAGREQEERRETRDGFLDEGCKAAGLPLLHVACKAGYNVGEVAAQVQAAMGQQPLKS